MIREQTPEPASPLPGAMPQRSRLVYALLAGAWILVVAWQIFEHDRVKTNARTALIDRSRDITTTLGLLIRSQRRWGAVSQERLESALSELVKSDQLSSVAMLNATGDVVASAGKPIDLETKGMPVTGVRWDHDHVTVVNLVDLGASLTEPDDHRPTIVLPPRDPREESDPGRRTRPPRPPGVEPGGRPYPETPRAIAEDRMEGPPGPPPDRGERGPRRRFGRPPWISEEEFDALLQRRGLHGLIIAMSTIDYRRTSLHDLWVRCVIGVFAGISALGLGLAWRNVGKTAQLQMRLLRASELNSHLKEMNIAAAGLAHETRNPLNIIRGQAQLLARHPDATDELRVKLDHIIGETDRVTAQLNEFISYSRPREPRLAPVLLAQVMQEVARTLESDLEDKQIALELSPSPLMVDADESLLRQALFNLLLNAVQAVPAQGQIQVHIGRADPNEVFLEIRDNGPGVSPQHQLQIFKPYFTTHQEGTGLGLAVVHQIVLAHGWEIHYLPNQPKGAIFRLSHLKLNTKLPEHAAGSQSISPTHPDRR